MKILNNITLIAVEGQKNGIDNSIKVLIHSSKGISFNKKILISPELNNLQKKIIIENDIQHYTINPLDWLGYNNFILTKLYDYIETDYCLVIQWDGFILNPDNWDDEFLNYDYIGSVWHDSDIKNSVWVYDGVKKNGNYSLVGNGGFSLRSKKLLKLTKETTHICYQTNDKFSKNNLLEGYVTLGPEDAYICINHYDYFKENGVNFAPIEVGNKFSRESNKSLEWNSVFGFHGEKNFINNI